MQQPLLDQTSTVAIQNTPSNGRIMMQKTMNCNSCVDGLVRNQFTKKLDTCKSCDGTGEIEMCEAFNSAGKTVIFRNMPCVSCGVPFNQHQE